MDYCLHNPLRICGAGDREPQSFQNRKEAFPYGGGAHGQHAQRHAFPVQKTIFFMQAFNAVTECVAEIQDTAQAVLFFILLHNILFSPEGIQNDTFQHRNRLTGGKG